MEQLVAPNPFNPDSLPDLENYVNEHVPIQDYLGANLCLLRLYRFEPEWMNTQIVLGGEKCDFYGVDGLKLLVGEGLISVNDGR